MFSRFDTLISSLLPFLLGGFFSGKGMLVDAQSEDYMYVIYYEESDCGTSAVSMAGHSSGDEEQVMGGLDNSTELCSLEATCLINNTTDLCQNVLERTKLADTRNDIDAQGRVFQCDDTNGDVDQPICRVLDGCYASSVYPHCNFQLRTTSELAANLDLILNVNAFENDGLDLQNFMSLYSDAECTEFEGTHGIVVGETTIYKTPATLGCQESVACAFYPDGEKCLSYGGNSNDPAVLRTKPAASKSIVCSNETDASCSEIEPSACVQSEYFPSCYSRMATAKYFFSQPEDFVKGEKFSKSAAATNSSSGGEGNGDEGGDEGTGSSAMGISMSATAVLLTSLWSIVMTQSL